MVNEEIYMETVEELKKKLLHKKVTRIYNNKLVLNDGTEVFFECTDQDCCAWAFGDWDEDFHEGLITDVQLINLSENLYGVDGYDKTASLVILHNNNKIANAQLEADAGNGGYYYSILSVFVDGEQVGTILDS